MPPRVHQCCYPIGEPRTPGFLFYAAPIAQQFALAGAAGPHHFSITSGQHQLFPLTVLPHFFMQSHPACRPGAEAGAVLTVESGLSLTRRHSEVVAAPADARNLSRLASRAESVCAPRVSLNREFIRAGIFLTITGLSAARPGCGGGWRGISVDAVTAEQARTSSTRSGGCWRIHERRR